MSAVPISQDEGNRAAARFWRAGVEAWYKLPVRWQLMTSITVISVGAVLFSIVLAIVDARGRVEVEVNSSMEVAHQLVNDAVSRAAAHSPGGDLLELLPEQLKYVRHARVLVSDKQGDLVQLAPDERAAGVMHHPERAPQWFADLVGPKVGTRQIRVMLGENRLGAIVIVGEPRDELAEVWEEASRRTVIWLAITCVMLVLLYVVLGRLLNPLVELGAGMHELEDGHYNARVAEPRVHELGAIAKRFNMLAGALEKARAENSRLYRNLIAVQEDERRRIANDLHDEAGPCLFGITANVASIARLAELETNAQSQPIKVRVEEIHAITERLKAINRDLLRSLRPVEIGRIPLTELIGSLVAGFERRYRDCAFQVKFGKVARSYGEDADLTIFRCVQEALTNAVKHGSASEISVYIGEESSADSLRLLIEDNGGGIVAGATLGLGITAMRERVRSIGGSSSIDGSPAGTTVSVNIPLNSRAARRQHQSDQIEEKLS